MTGRFCMSELLAPAVLIVITSSAFDRNPSAVMVGDGSWSALFL
jgi:hypothetical protein